jgi:hypothetical protein
MNNGWNIKRLIKQIIMSATYRQSSMLTKESQSTDPENIFLSHFPRLRLSAEMVRDHVLTSAGLLVKEIGGPSVNPYQPKGIWEAATSGRGLTKYIQDHDEKLYRKSMYTFIKRTVPPPSMLIFDASNRDQCEVKRLRTNTPLQALVMLNDPQVIEASRVLAETLINSTGELSDKIKNAFRRIVSRKPTSKEIKILSDYFNIEIKELEEPDKEFQRILNAGEYKHSANNIQTAALMQTILMIYNLDEAIVK